MSARLWNRFWKLTVLLLGLGLFFDIGSYLLAEGFWFQSAGYWQPFSLRVQTQLGLWLIAIGVSTSFLVSNLVLAQRLKYFKSPERPEWFKEKEPRDSGYPLSRGAGLSWLLPIAIALSLLASLILLHYGQAAATYWRPSQRLLSVAPSLPARFRPELIWQLGQQLWSNPWQLALLVGLAIALVIRPEALLITIAVALSFSFGLVLTGHWASILQYFHPTPFNQADPLFGADISFYIFTLPIWELLAFWLIGLFAYGLIAVLLIYLLSGNSLSEGRFPGFSQGQLQHLHGLGGCLMLAIAFSYWLSRYELLYSPQGVVYGAGYTDVVVTLPAYTGLSLLALGIALFLFWRTLSWSRGKCLSFRRRLYGLGLYVALATVTELVLPAAVQRLVVQPNELAREQPYIQRSIDLTRRAFDLAAIDVETFNPTGDLTYSGLQANDETIRNIRLWDTRPLLQTNRQLQQIRLYYRFPDADVDRYTVFAADADLTAPQPETEKQQVLIAARELDYSAVPAEAQTWVNQHLIYTHGFGHTISPVNTVGPGGLPDYFIKDIGPVPSSERIAASIPIGAPRIYYGELTDTYVMTPTEVREFDYPSGSENIYSVYTGRGGVPIGAFWRRLLFSKHMRDWQMLLTQDFTAQTKLLYRRNINQRVRAIAPFLQYDHDPYLVVADVNNEQGLRTNVEQPNPEPDEENYLYWIIDAYTTSDRYPYSDPSNYDFNYIRNSVKVVIDAYHGSVTFYVADARDPIIATWSRVFPGMFKPLSEMPVSLRTHIRYPIDFFKAQSQQLMTYHMTDPQVFYNREDQWRAPTEIYGEETQLVEPYYLIMRLPNAPEEEFILLRPFTPAQRNNLIAWLAARSDGEFYGRMLLYRFPKQELVYGPEQIEARINQDPIISQQISLWNRQGSRAVQGNLLVIPIEQSLLYVEPLYLEAEQTSLPTLVRVIVAYQNRIAMAETLNQALEAIFLGEGETPAPAIIRPVEEGASPSLDATPPTQ